MRFVVTLFLDSDRIPKDKNRIILSLIKRGMSALDQEFFEDLYQSGEARQKNFTFSLYMPDCKFHREEIEIPSKKMILNVSTYDMDLGVQLFNAFLTQVDKPYRYKEILLTVGKVRLQREKLIKSEKVLFQSMSPCVAREHRGSNKDNWFHSLSEERGQQVFLKNLKGQALKNFPDAGKDIEELSIRVLRNKEVKVKHYGIEVLANIVLFELCGKTYLLDYFYKAGAGSMKSAGFSMLSIKE